MFQALHKSRRWRTSADDLRPADPRGVHANTHRGPAAPPNLRADDQRTIIDDLTTSRAGEPTHRMPGNGRADKGTGMGHAVLSDLQHTDTGAARDGTTLTMPHVGAPPNTPTASRHLPPLTPPPAPAPTRDQLPQDDPHAEPLHWPHQIAAHYREAAALINQYGYATTVNIDGLPPRRPYLDWKAAAAGKPRAECAMDLFGALCRAVTGRPDGYTPGVITVHEDFLMQRLTVPTSTGANRPRRIGELYQWADTHGQTSVTAELLQAADALDPPTAGPLVAFDDPDEPEDPGPGSEQDDEIAEQIAAGLAEAQAGQTISLGSFAQYLTPEDDQDNPDEDDESPAGGGEDVDDDYGCDDFPDGYGPDPVAEAVSAPWRP